MPVTIRYGITASEPPTPVKWTETTDSEGNVLRAGGTSPDLWDREVTESEYLAFAQQQYDEYLAFKAQQLADLEQQAATDRQTRIDAGNRLIKHGKLTREQAGLLAGVDPALLDPKGKD